MGQTQILTFSARLESQECFKCGVTFAMPADMLATARRKGKEFTFYCPNGHGQCFTETEADRVRRELTQQLEAERRNLEWERVRAGKLRKTVIAQKGQMTRLRKRIGNGVCPCCHRTFKQLAAHMAQQHPEYRSESATSAPPPSDPEGQQP